MILLPTNCPQLGAPMYVDQLFLAPLFCVMAFRASWCIMYEAVWPHGPPSCFNSTSHFFDWTAASFPWYLLHGFEHLCPVPPSSSSRPDILPSSLLRGALRATMGWGSLQCESVHLSCSFFTVCHLTDCRLQETTLSYVHLSIFKMSQPGANVQCMLSELSCSHTYAMMINLDDQVIGLR